MAAGVHVVVDGDGPPVVLCGGLGGNWFDWNEVVDLLSGTNLVVRIDRPGYGLSPPSGERPSARGEAVRIAGVLDALHVSAPAVLVGHSLGGIYAEAFARLYPARTAAVILLDATVTTRPHRVIPTRWRVGTGRRVARFASRVGLQRLLGPTVRRILNHSTPPYGIAPDTRRWIERIYREPAYLESSIVENASYPALAQELAALRETTTLTAPVVVAAAHTGRATPWGSAWIRTQRQFAEFLGAAFRVVSPAHHHAMIDQPGQIAALARELAS
ncbi:MULTISPECIES: alpha/beta fold hydrolase [unclassified Rhodococcus (in: high G+C Gram-positive bacteria)]|uniref:alpha/beta fold hydrolase n=1 Tax=unclassified Rhodococcus (in: high G+C Gram-positive bacteria) TaxID=192944 RepID=UPI001639AB79|nr:MULTISPECIES: alpha/beta hydrolase [unclassified Rhodococcus (in: high G+C Gram-positive bacteria)]MBC2641136.1 alpha/beta hydrolase [Rhodococcus sp. 3A]MBC2894119.1 alpha/beta hydrolase [Rhodococcus sp. 4CII]